MKRIHIETLGDKTAKVYRDSEWNEYRVRLYIAGELRAAADYFTDDRADALSTAAAMVQPRPRQEIAPTSAARPLSRAFNVAVLHITGRALPMGFDVSDKAPSDYDALVSHYRETGRILVWSGASDHTIFDDSDVNIAFRAWHDSKHVIHGFPFTLAGEVGAMKRQKADVRAIYDGASADYFCRLLTAEIFGQFKYNQAHGGFPIDQMGFARAYMADKQAALAGDFGISRAA